MCIKDKCFGGEAGLFVEEAGGNFPLPPPVDRTLDGGGGGLWYLMDDNNMYMY